MLVVIIGLAAGIGSLYYAKDWVSKNQETVNVPVPAEKISANTIIQADDLTTKPYIKAAISNNVELNQQKIIGKAAVTDLYPGELVLKSKLKSNMQVLKPGEVFVTVKAESLEQILGGNICRNMIVDVIYTEEAEKPPVLLAENAIVVAVMDEKGKSMAEPVAVAQAAIQGITGREKAPQYVMLKIKRKESYEFTRPLNGGHILITQVGQIKPPKIEVKPEIKSKEKEAEKQQQSSKQQAEPQSGPVQQREPLAQQPKSTPKPEND